MISAGFDLCLTTLLLLNSVGRFLNHIHTVRRDFQLWLTQPQEPFLIGILYDNKNTDLAEGGKGQVGVNCSMQLCWDHN